MLSLQTSKPSCIVLAMTMRYLCLLSLLHAAFGGGTLKLTWHDCGDASTHAKVTDLKPDAVVLGQKTTITGTGTVDEAVLGGTFEMDVKVSFITEKFTGDLCEAKTFSLPGGLGTMSWDG